jgi:hypothetical protein
MMKNELECCKTKWSHEKRNGMMENKMKGMIINKMKVKSIMKNKIGAKGMIEKIK